MESKMDLNKTGHKHLLEFQELIYHILNAHNEEINMEGELDMGTGINIQAAVLLKTAMELYAIHFPKDEDVLKILDVAKSSISQVRNRIDSEIDWKNINPNQTYH